MEFNSVRVCQPLGVTPMSEVNKTELMFSCDMSEKVNLSPYYDQFDVVQLEKSEPMGSPGVNRQITDLYANRDIWNSSRDQNSPILEYMSSSNLFLPTIPSNHSINSSVLTSTTSIMSPVSSSSESLCLIADISQKTTTSNRNTNNFVFNQTFYNLQSDLQTNQNYTTSVWNSQMNTVNFDNSNIGMASSKQDVSVGTELSLNRDMKYKKDFQWLHNYKQPNVGDESLANQLSFNYVAQTGQGSAGGKKQVESFKICEKLAPKKSRTKYTKDHIICLEAAFVKNQYPDQYIIETLCKSLNISKEKINIWFQNRRARNKRLQQKPKAKTSTESVSMNSSIQGAHSDPPPFPGDCGSGDLLIQPCFSNSYINSFNDYTDSISPLFYLV